MSNASPFRRSTPELPSTTGVQRLQSFAVGSAQFAGFWSAVVLPFAMLALIVSGSVVQQVPLFVGLLLANVAALRVGHGHKQD
ncbi:hypothetical protein HZS55_04500 [Halosimplex rubrum]|uniref:Uncharacterized protein n=1 Tax=Halosimplex rubrum TaxID=869889 RepID=A0A7D5T467_9EURY|nr:hypothetical protein [Halosimplex rubrum]QLH76609.1 hypothetical protein HZS55_04500 [Halosimplex rubrum]